MTYLFPVHNRSLYVPSIFCVQAAVRAMDTITAFANQLNASHNINKFVVSGASKVKKNI